MLPPQIHVKLFDVIRGVVDSGGRIGLGRKSMSQVILKAENVMKYYGGRGNVTKAVDDISFEIYKSEFVGIMGASGSGKTTLLNCISTIDTVTAGHIVIEGQDITKFRGGKLADFRREKLGFIFQHFNLLDTMTAYENIALALSILKVPADKIDKRIKETAALLDIGEVLEKYPYEMSGGQQQRVAAARAIITKPALVLADEPTGALDSRSAKMLLSQMAKLNEAEQATIMMVTHDSMAASYCQRIIFIKDGHIFDELIKGQDSRKEFYGKILNVVALLGGDSDED